MTAPLSDTDLCLVVGHRRPDFPVWPGWQFATRTPVEAGDFPITTDIDERLPDSIIGEYQHLFALSRQLRRAPGPSSIRIAQYRRLVVNVPLGVRADNQPWTKIVSIETARNLEAFLLTEPGPTGFLISTIHRVPTTLADYSSSHLARDYLRFLSETVDAGLLTDAEVTNAALLDGLIPAPSNGTFPVKIFIDIMSLLEAAALRFVENGFIQREGYQRRSLGFCLERLNSYCLLRALFAQSIDFGAVQGHQLTFADGGFVPTGA